MGAEPEQGAPSRAGYVGGASLGAALGGGARGSSKGKVLLKRHDPEKPNKQ